VHAVVVPQAERRASGHPPGTTQYRSCRQILRAELVGLVFNHPEFQLNHGAVKPATRDACTLGH
jgi:hypothetical protein